MAGVGALSRVAAKMQHEVLVPCEPLGAVRTRKRAIARVDTAVVLQVGGVVRRVGAIRTSVAAAAVC